MTLLVLDLDETLVHASVRYPVGKKATQVGSYMVQLRPGVLEFLDWCEAFYAEVAIWTAATLPYASEVIDKMLGGCERFAFVWGRRRITYAYDHETRERYAVKDLRKLRRRGYDKRRILAVDDTPQKWIRSYGNYVPIRAFEGQEGDKELEYLQAYLEQLGPEANVRHIEKRFWRQAYPSA